MARSTTDTVAALFMHTPCLFWRQVRDLHQNPEPVGPEVRNPGPGPGRSRSGLPVVRT